MLIRLLVILALIAGLSALQIPLASAEEATPEVPAAPAVEEVSGEIGGEPAGAGAGEIEQAPTDSAPADEVVAPVEPPTDTGAAETVVEETATLEAPAPNLVVDDPLAPAVEETAPPVAATPTGDATATGPPREESSARLSKDTGLVVAATPVDEVETDPGTGRLVVAKTDHMGDPLPDAAFAVYTDAGEGVRGELVGEAVSDASGLATIGGLSPGAYLLVESAAPDGFVAAPDQGFAITGPGETVQLTVVNLPIDDPATGRVQIVACVFPTDGAPRTEIDVLIRPPLTIAASEPGDGCVPAVGNRFVFTDAASGAVAATLVTDEFGLAVADLPPGEYTLTDEATGLTTTGTIEGGAGYFFFVQRFVAPGDLPDDPGGDPGEPGENGFGTVEIFAFACSEGGTGTEFVVAVTPAQEETVGVLAADAESSTGVIVEDAAVPDTCQPTSTVLQVDGNPPFQVIAGVEIFGVPAGTYTLTEVCSGAAVEHPVFAGRTTKIILLDFDGACPDDDDGGGTPSPVTKTPVPQEPNEETPVPTPAATRTSGGVGGGTTTLPNTGAGERAGDARYLVGSLLLVALSLAALAAGYDWWGRIHKGRAQQH